MKALRKVSLLAIPLFLLSSCYVKVENGHRHWHYHHRGEREHHEVIIEKR